MKLEVRRDSIVIVPEGDIDRAYIEDTLGLTSDGDSVPLRRVAPLNLSMSIACLQAKKVRPS